jgi:hypothetical protein
VKIRVPVPAICADDLESARALLQAVYEEEMRFPGSPVTPELVQLNLDHTDRVRANAAAIAVGEGLDDEQLQLAAILHDVSKLDHRETSAGGIDTWHHHYRGASLAKKLILVNLNLDSQVADPIVRMIEAHSDIPFIRRYWEGVYHSSLPTPMTAEEFAFRDADTVDLLWVGGMSKIVHIRQVPGSAFDREDGGDIRKAIISARGSFLESVSVLATSTGRDLAVSRILLVESFFDIVMNVKNLREFEQAYDWFIAEKCN